MKKIQTPLKTIFSRLEDPKSSKRRYQNNPKMEFFSGVGQNIKIMLSPARGFTFRGSSYSKIIFFQTFFHARRKSFRPSVFPAFWSKKMCQRVPTITQKTNRKQSSKWTPKKNKKINLSCMGTGSAINYESLASICNRFSQTLTEFTYISICLIIIES